MGNCETDPSFVHNRRAAAAGQYSIASSQYYSLWNDEEEGWKSQADGQVRYKIDLDNWLVGV